MIAGPTFCSSVKRRQPSCLVDPLSEGILICSASNLSAGVSFGYDNNGWLDSCGIGQSRIVPDKSEIRIWRNCGARPWHHVTANLELDAFPMNALRAVIAAEKSKTIL